VRLREATHKVRSMIDEGPRLPSSGNSPALPNGSSVSYRQCRFPPPSAKMGSQGPPVPRAARTCRREPKLSSTTGDPHTTNACGQVRRLRLARAGGGPHVLSDPPPTRRLPNSSPEGEGQPRCRSSRANEPPPKWSRSIPTSTVVSWKRERRRGGPRRPTYFRAQVRPATPAMEERTRRTRPRPSPP